MIALIMTGVLFSGLLFFGAQWLVDTGIVRDQRAYWSLLALSPAVFCATLLATLRGYFQGLQLMTPTAVSQILEQVVRVVTMIAFAVILLPYGLEFGAAGATLGAAPGAFMGILVLIGFYYMTRNWRKELASEQDTSIKPQSAMSIIKRLLVLAIPVSLANIMLPIVSNIDLLIVPRRLEVAGFAVEEATTLFGYLTGMATALVNMPTIVTASLAASLVPVISEAIAQKKDDVVMTRTDTAMRLANLITIPAFIGMCVIATPISDMLYATRDAGPCIAVMSPFLNMVVSACVKVFLSWNLTAIPAWGVLGAAWATNADFGVAAALNLIFLYKYRRYTMDILHTVKLFIAAGIMGAVVLSVYHAAFTLIHSNTLSTLASIAVGGVVYLVAIVVIRAVKPEDVQGVPKIGPKLAAMVSRMSFGK